MGTTLEAIFDGNVFRPASPVHLPPNTSVRITVELLPDGDDPASFLRTARALNLEGPPDWASNLGAYLHGEGGTERAD